MIRNTPLSIIIHLFGADVYEPEEVLSIFRSKSVEEQSIAIRILDECIVLSDLYELDDMINMDDFKDHDHRVLFLKDIRKHLLENGPIPNIEDYLID